MKTESAKMKHTPGPWTVGVRMRNDSIGIRGPNGIYLAEALDFNEYSRDTEVKANAHLIAAAPELLEACKKVVEEWKKLNPSVLFPAIDILPSIIRKAEGR